jgi:hypothetical protein
MSWRGKLEALPFAPSSADRVRSACEVGGSLRLVHLPRTRSLDAQRGKERWEEVG